MKVYKLSLLVSLLCLCLSVSTGIAGVAVYYPANGMVHIPHLVFEGDPSGTVYAVDLQQRYGTLIFDVVGANLASTEDMCPIDCTDVDRDGFFAEGGACGPKDCNDNNEQIHQNGIEICGDSIDQDCSGNDIACATQPVYQLSDLTGTWYMRGLFTQKNGMSDNYGFDTGTLTIQSNGSYAGQLCDESNSCWSESGVADVSSEGVVTLWNGASLQMGIDKNLFVGNYKGNNEYVLDAFIKKSGSYSTNDLTGSWYMRSLGTQKNGKPDAFGYDTGQFTFQSSGAYTGQVCDDEGSCWNESGNASVTSNGKVSLWPGEAAEIGNGKDVIIGNYQDSDSVIFDVWVKKASSYTVADLKGTWIMKGLFTGRNNLLDNFGYDTCEITFQSNGVYSGTCSDQDGDTWAENGQATVHSNGVVNLFGEDKTNMSASKNTMIGNYKGSNELGLDVWVKISEN